MVSTQPSDDGATVAGNGLAHPPHRNGRRGPRIALYSHDTQGLGHVRRNLLVARALGQGGSPPVILVLSGLREATAFPMPPGVDCLTLPSVGKGVDGRYVPRSLDVPMVDLLEVRSRAIHAVLRSFDPDIMIVDKVPRGVYDELVPALAQLRARGRARIVLGLREVLDDPPTVRREWEDGQYAAALRAYYDRIWIYGDPAVYDPVAEYSFPADIAAMVRYAGYLNPRHVRPPGDEADLLGFGGEPGQVALCLVGGGADGVPLAEAFLRTRLPGRGALVTGPLMPEPERRRLRELAAGRGDLRVLEFMTDPCPLLARADRIIAMGGYNTTCEVLAYGRPAMIVPRVRPRTEQLIRASRLAGLGLVDILHPRDLSPDALGAWLAQDRGAPPPAEGVIDFGGVKKLPALLAEVRGARPLAEAIHAGP
jgi:predicted glycosyltransferase